MSVWHENRPELLEAELKSLDHYGIDHKRIYTESGNNKLIIQCSIPEGCFGNDTGDTLVLQVVYPDNFPYFRPEVQAFSLELPRHQNPLGKNLCLLGRSSDYWNVQTIGDYLNERLPLVFDQGRITDSERLKDIPDEQAEPISAYYLSEERIAVTSGRPQILNQETPEPSIELTVLNSGQLKLGLPPNFDKSNILDEKGSPLRIHFKHWMSAEGNPIPDDYEAQLDFTRIKPSSWYLLSKFPDPDFLGNFFQNLNSLITAAGSTPLKALNIKTKNCNHQESCCLIFPEEQEPGVYNWGWISVFFSTTSNLNKRKHRQFQQKFPIFSKVISLSPTDLALRIPQSKSLSNKTVGVIGAGAIGAPTVLEFARNGCYRIKILDRDAVEGTNTVRWPLGQEYIGWNKVYALEHFLKKNYPSVKVIPFHHWLGNPFNSTEDENEILDEFMRDCDIIVDASVEQGVNHLISARCRNWSIPYVLLEGRRGGWGGLVARILPKADKGCWMCLQNKLYLESEKDNIPLPPEDTSGTVQERGCGDVTFTGANFDMMNLSLAAVKLAADTLSIEKEFDWDVAVLSTIEKGGNKKNLPEWRKYPLPISTNCCYKDDFHK